MPNSYDVDDILEEIKRKKSAKSAQEHNAQRMKPTAWDRVETPAPVNTPAPEQVQQASSLEGLADFFGSNAKFDIGVQDKKASWRSAVSDRKEPEEKTEEESEIPAQLEPSFLDAQQPEDKESVKSSN